MMTGSTVLVAAQTMAIRATAIGLRAAATREMTAETVTTAEGRGTSGPRTSASGLIVPVRRLPLPGEMTIKRPEVTAKRCFLQAFASTRTCQ